MLTGNVTKWAHCTEMIRQWPLFIALIREHQLDGRFELRAI